MERANAQRIEYLIKGLAAFGYQEGKGTTRLAYTKLDRDAQNWLLKQIKDLNLEIREDAVGNLFMRRPGTRPELPPVASGSHLDSVRQAGAYDGICGVVSALEALYLLKDQQLERSLEVIVFRAEESSRFGCATIGSKLVAGKITPEKVDACCGKDDITFSQALKEWGCDPAEASKAAIPAGSYKCFAELHIEQGKVLEQKQLQLGIVQNIAAPTRFKVQVQGMADHSGATPMGMRKDALVAAAKIVLAVEAAATAEKENGTVGTIGVLEIEAGSINVIPGTVNLKVDIRGVKEESIKKTVAAFEQALEEISSTSGVKIIKDAIQADKPVALSQELAQKLVKICQEKQYSYLEMNSGAGHDSMHMAELCPTVMLFVPCKDGVSHNPAEHAEIPDICRGAEVLAEFLAQEAK